jgi:hypothetical protein
VLKEIEELEAFGGELPELGELGESSPQETIQAARRRGQARRIRIRDISKPQAGQTRTFRS